MNTMIKKQTNAFGGTSSYNEGRLVEAGTMKEEDPFQKKVETLEQRDNT